MTKTEILEKYGDVCQKLMNEANHLCGAGKVFIGPKEHDYGIMLYLSYVVIKSMSLIQVVITIFKFFASLQTIQLWML